MGWTTRERLQEFIEWVVLLQVRVRRWGGTRRRNRVRSEAIATTRHTLENARRLKAKNIQTVFNVGLYVLLLDQDLADFTDDMLRAVGARRRGFVAKYQALLLYEAAEDLPQMLGREFRSAATTLGATPEQLQGISEASAGLNAFWRSHRGFLGTVRKALSAHREHDALEYIDLLDTVSPLAVMECAAEFSQHLQRLILVLTDLGGLTTGLSAVVRDVLRAGPENRAG